MQRGERGVATHWGPSAPGVLALSPQAAPSPERSLCFLLEVDGASRKLSTCGRFLMRRVLDITLSSVEFRFPLELYIAF